MNPKLQEELIKSYQALGELSHIVGLDPDNDNWDKLVDKVYEIVEELETHREAEQASI